MYHRILVFAINFTSKLNSWLHSIYINMNAIRSKFQFVKKLNVANILNFVTAHTHAAKYKFIFTPFAFIALFN